MLDRYERVSSPRAARTILRVLREFPPSPRQTWNGLRCPPGPRPVFGRTQLSSLLLAPLHHRLGLGAQLARDHPRVPPRRPPRTSATAASSPRPRRSPTPSGDRWPARPPSPHCGLEQGRLLVEGIRYEKPVGAPGPRTRRGYPAPFGPGLRPLRCPECAPRLRDAAALWARAARPPRYRAGRGAWSPSG